MKINEQQSFFRAKMFLFLLKQKTKHKTKRKQKKTKKNLIRRVWGQVRSPFGQPHLTLKTCKPSQKHKTKKQKETKQNQNKREQIRRV